MFQIPRFNITTIESNKHSSAYLDLGMGITPSTFKMKGHVNYHQAKLTLSVFLDLIQDICITQKKHLI